MKIKNITFIGLNYAPEDSAIGLYSTQWVDFLAENGYNVTVITAFPYYPQWEISKAYKSKKAFLKEKDRGINILRYKQYVPKEPTFLKRIIHLSDFTLGSIINLFKIKECDLVISIVPFTSAVFLGYIQKKRFKAKLWMHIQDFEFDAALQTGIGKNENSIFKLLFKFEKWLFNKADIASTISNSMLKKLEGKTKSEQFFLPNWIDEHKIDPSISKAHNYLKSNRIKILYSGNIGDKQDWDTFITFCKDIDSTIYEVIIVGDGSKKSWVFNQITNFKHVKYYPPVPYNELSNLLCSTDIHILFQKPEVIDTVMPSKVLGMMASGKPSIIIGNNHSEINTIFEESKGGLYFPEYNSNLIDSLNEMAKNKELMVEYGLNAREYVVNNFSKSKILSKMLYKIQEI